MFSYSKVLIAVVLLLGQVGAVVAAPSCVVGTDAYYEMPECAAARASNGE